jgi:hypothetical protein
MIKSLTTPTNNHIDKDPQIIAKIDEPSIVYKVITDTRDVVIRIAIILSKFFDFPFPQLKKGAMAINKIIGAIIGANVAL